MSADMIPSDSATAPNGASFRLPRPVWILAVGLVLPTLIILILVGYGYYSHRRQSEAIQAIEALSGLAPIRRGGPDWLRERVGDEWMKCFDFVPSADLSDT